MHKAFSESLSKIEWANEHINELERRLRLFNQTDSYVIHVNYDLDAGCDVLKIESTQAVPDNLVLIVGDALNNLRSALDYIMRPFVFKTTEYTKFPICRDLQAFKAAINGGLKSNSTEDFRRILAETIQPYSRGYGQGLVPLHDLNIADKHNLLIAKVQITLVSNVRGIDESGAEFLLPHWLIVYPFVASHQCVGYKNLKITYKGKATCGIVFGEGMPLQGRLILPELKMMSMFANSTLNVFKTLYVNGFR
jgi:hypothetical protein